MVGRGAHSSPISSPRARRSAALPASPWPSPEPLKASGCSSRGPRPAAAAAAAPPGPDAHGGGAAQSRGGFLRGRSSRRGSEAGLLHRSSASSSAPSGPSAVALIPAPTAAAAASSSTGAWPGVACAASRRAQSWNVGHTGNADERQYASWCASARGAGLGSAKHRCRWSGRSARASRSSSKATNGQAGEPSAPGSPRSVIAADDTRGVFPWIAADSQRGGAQWVPPRSVAASTGLGDPPPHTVISSWRQKATRPTRRSLLHTGTRRRRSRTSPSRCARP